MSYNLDLVRRALPLRWWNIGRDWMNGGKVVEAPEVVEEEIIPFTPFPKIARFSRDVIVTEKLDGSNSAVVIHEDGRIFAQSRNRIITPDADNYGFAKWVKRNEKDLALLGPGVHFGEWWGNGIQRKYGQTEKRFSLFNVTRWGWHGQERPACCDVVPTLWQGSMIDLNVREIMENLSLDGSHAAPGFMRPEGIVVFHSASRSMFKVTCDKDDEYKGQAAHAAAETAGREAAHDAGDAILKENRA